MSSLNFSTIISDGMIMQRDEFFPIRSRKKVTVTFLGKTYEAEETNGKWLVKLDPVSAGGPFEMDITSDDGTIKIKDVYAGDVWLCSGQSNMETQMARLKDDYKEEWDFTKDDDKLDLSLIRQFKVPQEWDFSAPREDLTGGSWLRASRETLDEFSAVAWFFAKEIRKKYRVPVGLIMTAWGGTPVESWMSEESLSCYPAKIAEGRQYAAPTKREEITNNTNKAIEEWEINVRHEDTGIAQLWQKPQTDISGWNDITLPCDFEEAGIKQFCGSIWLAKDFNVSSDLAAKNAKVWLGTIVDADTVYINGVEAGNTGYRYPPRKYNIPDGLLKEGVNRIVIRITCVNGEGGVTKNKPLLVFTDNESVELSGTWKYKIGKTASARPDEFFFQRLPMGNYNAMIDPVLKFPLKGVIWYQGESNESNKHEYANLFQLMIKSWRKKNREDLPFLFVQLPIWKEMSDNNEQAGWAILREAQRAALSLPFTGIAAALELGEWNDIHPVNKKDVGIRLFLAAEKLLFGVKNTSPGPVIREQRIQSSGSQNEKQKIYLYFDNCGDGLTTVNTVNTNTVNNAHVINNVNAVYVSVIGDEGQIRLPAEIEGADVISIDLSGVKNPRKILYAWADNPIDRQLFNSDRLPALPFKIELAGLEGNQQGSRTSSMFNAAKTRDEIVNWIRDYFENNGSGCNAVIGISGGKDSAVVAALCARALGTDRVFGVLMPQGEQHDICYSRDIVNHLGIKHTVINIKDNVNSILSNIEKTGLTVNRQAIVNTPARIRMTILYAVSAIVNGRVANTCNLSEDWVGYSTKYGDSAGDFSPISQLTVTEVKEVGKLLNLPVKFIDKIPEDGLSGLSDEDNLGFTYNVLDRYIREGVCEDITVKEKIDRLNITNQHKFNLMPSYKRQI